MRETKEHLYDKRSFEDRIILDRSLIRTRPVSIIKRESKPQTMGFYKRQYGENLVGEIIETISGSHYVIRKVVKEGLEASPLGEYRGDRPHIVTISSAASGIVADKKKIGFRHRTDYKKILLEIQEEGGNVEMPPEKNGLFDLSQANY